MNDLNGRTQAELDAEDRTEAAKEIARLRADLAASVRDWNVVHPARVREIEAAQADNARLRTLIKAQELGSKHEAGPFCPWCGCGGEGDPRHAADCPAFTPSGDVR